MQIPERAVGSVVVNCLFPILSLFVVTARVNTRVFMLHNVGADDYLIVAAMIAALAFWTVFMLQVRAGLGRQITFLELPGFLYALWATVPIYNLSLILTKLSITVQCCRVFRTPAMQKFLRSYLFLLSLYGAFAVLGTVFNCWPVSAYWAATQGVEGVCMDKSVLTFMIAGVNIVTDIVLVVVPIPLLWKLQIPKRQKIVLCCVFGVGSVACVTSVVRLHSLYMIGTAPQSAQSVQGVDIATMSCIEINIAIICASIPALKPLAVKVFPKMLLSDLYAKSKRAYGGMTSASRSRTGKGLKSQTDTHTTSTSRKWSRKDQIVVQQSVELQSVPTRELDEASREGNVSRDGSEKALVIQGQTEGLGASRTHGWHVDIYSTRDGRKKGTLSRKDSDMV